jgi:hypothetical protein
MAGVSMAKPPAEVEAEETGKDVWRRYYRYRRALSGTVADALASVAGMSGSLWSARISDEAIHGLMTQRGLTVHALALKTGVPYREVSYACERAM